MDWIDREFVRLREVDSPCDAGAVLRERSRSDKSARDDGMDSSLYILYLGHNFGNSQHRADALRRLGHKVDVIDPWEFLPDTRIMRKILRKLTHEAGPAFLEPYVRKKLEKRLKNNHFDVIWSNQCELIGSATALMLKRHAHSMVTYVNDDPVGPRDKRLFSLYRHAVKHYDLHAVVRWPNVEEVYAYGAAKVIRVFMSADEVAHRPLVLTAEENKRWASDVTFIGTWMPERGPFLARLMELGVPLTLYGDRWQRAREWPFLKKIWYGPGLVGDAYVKAIQAARVCIGLLSKGNRDLHTSRSAEIPYIGSVLCAERTVEHMAMYRENKEAVFWSTPEECAEKCFSFLSDESRRKTIARAGRERCLRSGYLNEPIMETILKSLLKRESVSIPSHPSSGWTSQ